MDSFELCDYLSIPNVNRVLEYPTTILEAELQGRTIASARLMRHKPSRRVLVEYRLDAAEENKNSGPLLVGKARWKGLDRHTPKLHVDLKSAGFTDRSFARVPRFLGIVPDLRMWFQRKSNGKPVPISENSDIEVHDRVAKALSFLHRCGVVLDRQYTVVDELKSLDRQLKSFVDAFPSYQERVDVVWKHCIHAGGIASDSPKALIHRDFYFDQVLVDEDSITLLDLDLAVMGPSELDVGNYIAHLWEYGVRIPCFAETCSKAAHRFAESYLRSKTHATVRSIQAWTDLSLVRHMYLSMQFPDRLHTTTPLLDALVERGRFVLSL